MINSFPNHEIWLLQEQEPGPYSGVCQCPKIYLRMQVDSIEKLKNLCFHKIADKVVLLYFSHPIPMPTK